MWLCSAECKQQAGQRGASAEGSEINEEDLVQVSPHVQAFDFSHRPFDII
jgi:hypothetical protein